LPQHASTVRPLPAPQQSDAGAGFRQVVADNLDL